MTPETGKLATTLRRLVTAVEQILDEENVTYPELFSALLFLDRVGTAGEMVLLSDVLGVSTNVEQRDSAGVGGTASNVEGPFWRAGAPRYASPADLVTEGEPGERQVISGRVTDAETGEPLPGTEVDVWQTDAAGHYDHEDSALAEWHMRGVVVADERGQYSVRVVKPVAYQVPTSGPVGELLDAIGQHPWRPAHTPTSRFRRPDTPRSPRWRTTPATSGWTTTPSTRSNPTSSSNRSWPRTAAGTSPSTSLSGLSEPA